MAYYCGRRTWLPVSIDCVLTRRAVDQKTKDYWEAYYGGYGSQLVRDIPRRITASLTAGLRGRVVEATVAPLGRTTRSRDGTHAVEGAFRAVLRVGSQKHQVVRRLFRADIAADGSILSLDSIPCR